MSGNAAQEAADEVTSAIEDAIAEIELLHSQRAELITALGALVQTFHARPDMLRLCGFQEHAQLKAACDALNKVIKGKAP